MRNDITEAIGLWISIITLLAMTGLIVAALTGCATDAASSPQSLDGGSCGPSSGPIPQPCLGTDNKAND